MTLLEIMAEVWLIGWTFEYWAATVWTLATTVAAIMVPLTIWLERRDARRYLRKGPRR